MADDVRIYPCPINKILRQSEFQDTLNHAAHYVNNVYIMANQLLNLYAIDIFQNGTYKDIVKLEQINRLTARYCLIIASSGHYGNTRDESTLEVKEHLQKLYDLYIKPYIKTNWSVRQTFIKNITNSLDNQIITNVNVNIKEHFHQRVKDFVNKMLHKKHESKEQYKLHKSQLRKVKDDILNGTLYSDEQYHMFIIRYRCQIIPIPNINVNIDLQANTMRYLYPTMYMNYTLEKHFGSDVKLFKCLPLRDSCINHFIPIDYQILVWLFPEYLTETLKISKSELLKSKYRHDIFNSIFNMDSKFFKEKRVRVFDYLINTDGQSCRLTFRTRQSQEKRHNEGTQTTRTKSYQFESKQERSSSKKRNKLCYVNDLCPDTKLDLLDKPIVGVDPGKNDLYTGCTIVQDSPLFFSYSSKKQKSKDYSKKRSAIQLQLKNELGITELETELSQQTCSSRRSVNLKCFSQYVKLKLHFMIEVEDKYFNSIWNKLSWRSFIRKQQVKEEILKSFTSNIPNKESVICFGDWSHKCKTNLKNNTPTQGISLIRNLRRYYTNFFLIDEFRTSCVCHNCHDKTEKFIITPSYRKVHKVLRCKNEHCRTIWNRDNNGSLNILTLGKFILHDMKLPEIFRRNS